MNPDDIKLAVMVNESTDVGFVKVKAGGSKVINPLGIEQGVTCTVEMGGMIDDKGAGATEAIVISGEGTPAMSTGTGLTLNVLWRTLADAVTKGSSKEAALGPESAK